MSDYELVVIGSGLSGSILARKIAEEKHKKVLVIEKRNHIGGNVYDEIDENGIRIQKYGPHTFHTNKTELYEYVAQYVELVPFRIQCSAVIDGMITPSPFNFTTIEQLYSKAEATELITRLKSSYKMEEVPITELIRSDDEKIRSYARYLFEKDYRRYTSKQWGIPPEEIDPSVLRRVPVLLSYRDYIYREKYEVVPKHGFTSLIHEILTHKNIQIQLGKDGVKELSFYPAEGIIQYKNRTIPIIFTGAVDELFQYRFGKLPYRSLNIRYEYYNQKEVQRTALVIHPGDQPYTRTTEYTKFPEQNRGNKTVVGFEYPCEYQGEDTIGNERYYPVITEKNNKLFQQYKDYATQFSNLTLCGRLADYKYYNMDQAIEHALEVYKEFK